MPTKFNLLHIITMETPKGFFNSQKYVFLFSVSNSAEEMKCMHENEFSNILP